MEVQTSQSISKPSEAAGKLVLPAATLLALLSASCCVLPIGLSLLGLGGAWLTFLGPFVAYRSAILALVAAALMWAWYRVLRPQTCAVRKTSTLIWTLIATVAFIIAATSPLWEETAARTMWGLVRTGL